MAVYRLHVYLRFLRRLFKSLPRRAILTIQYQGPREALWRLVTFPLRLTPLGPRLGLVARVSDPAGPARAWYSQHGRSVAVVIPSYGPAKLALKAARSVKRTTAEGRVRVIVADDGSDVREVDRLRASKHVDAVVTGENAGFAANCNRGVALAREDEDVVLLNSDVVAHRGWLEVLQHAAFESGGPDVGVVGGKLLYGDDTIQFAGTVRNPDAPEWFDHRWRGRPADFPAAEVMQPTLAVTGACMYIRKETIAAVGVLDEEYGMAYEDVDYCLRVWDAGMRVIYTPAASLTHHESRTRGMAQGPRELASQKLFWDRWSDWFDRRETRAADGGVRVIYVTQDVGVGGGHRVVFEHLEGLAERGHHTELWTLADGPPDWYDLKVPVRSFPDYAALARELAPVDAVKVATWWETAAPVWEASVRRGVPVYFVQDLETSYYPEDFGVHGRVLASYQPEFEFLTTSNWVFVSLLHWVPEATVISPGVDTGKWRPLAGVDREDDTLLALGRGNPLKDFPLTRAAYAELTPRPRLWLFGIEPDVAEGMGDSVTYHYRPSDGEVNELLNRATAFLQTSRHEGFCLPVLEAMAAGAPVVCTNAHGNVDFCEDGVNCLMVAKEPGAVRAGLRRVLDDPQLRERLVAGGFETARRWSLEAKLDELDVFYRDLADQRASGELPAPATRPAQEEWDAIVAAVNA